MPEGPAFEDVEALPDPVLRELMLRFYYEGELSSFTFEFGFNSYLTE